MCAQYLKILLYLKYGWLKIYIFLPFLVKYQLYCMCLVIGLYIFINNVAHKNTLCFGILSRYIAEPASSKALIYKGETLDWLVLFISL